MRNHSNENEFDLHENGRAGETHFHMNGFARRLVLTEWQKVTRKWRIVVTLQRWLKKCAVNGELYHWNLIGR